MQVTNSKTQVIWCMSKQTVRDTDGLWLQFKPSWLGTSCRAEHSPHLLSAWSTREHLILHGSKSLLEPQDFRLEPHTGQRYRLESYLTCLAAMLNRLALLLVVLKGSKKNGQSCWRGGQNCSGKTTPEDPQLLEEAYLMPVSRKSPETLSPAHLQTLIHAKLRGLVGSMAPTPALQPGEISGYLRMGCAGAPAFQLLARNGQGAWKRTDIA